MSEKEDFIATLTACYFGDKNAYKKIIRMYEEKENRINKAMEDIEKYKNMDLSKYDENEIEIDLINHLLEILKGGNNE